MGRSERKSGLELLRIIAMLGVVLLHYNDGRAFVYTKGDVNYYVLMFMEGIFICAVNVFLLISGYFLSGTQKRSYIKPLELIVQFVFIKELFYFISVAMRETSFSLAGVVYSMVPNSYFTILYCTLYCISPYINRIFAGFRPDQWKRFLVVLLVLFSLWPTVTDLAEELLGVQWTGISTITLKGAHQGFNIVNFCLIYCIGAYFRFNGMPKLLQSKKWLIAGILVVPVLIFGWAFLTRGAEFHEMRSAWMYHNPLVILMAVLVFVLFSSFEFRNKTINALAGASFTCFLLHGYLLDYAKIEKYATGNVFIMLAHILVVQISCYAISYVAYKIYSLLTGWFFKLLQKNIPFLQLRNDI